MKGTLNTLPSNLDESSVINKIAVACDAGMGSSAMGASKLKTAIDKVGTEVKVINVPIDQLDSSIDLVITHQQLTARAKSKLPNAYHISISDFIATPVYDLLADYLAENKGAKAQDNSEATQANVPPTLTMDNIRIGLPTMSKEEAIRLAGQILYDGGYVEEAYIDAMVERDKDLSTFIGNGTAIPHGVSEAKKKIKYTGLSVLQFPEGVDFDGNTVYLVVGIAGLGNEHLTILSNLAEIVEVESKVEQLRQTKDATFIYNQFTN